VFVFVGWGFCFGLVFVGVWGFFCFWWGGVVMGFWGLGGVFLYVGGLVFVSGLFLDITTKKPES